MSSNEIPDPAFWAITSTNGAQLISPGSELHTTINDNLGSIPMHGVVATGDILIVSKSSYVISPEDLNIDRSVIASYRIDPSKSTIRGLRNRFK